MEGLVDSIEDCNTKLAGLEKSMDLYGDTDMLVQPCCLSVLLLALINLSFIHFCINRNFNFFSPVGPAIIRM